jgi:hypothetical protein
MAHGNVLVGRRHRRYQHAAGPQPVKGLRESGTANRIDHRVDFRRQARRQTVPAKPNIEPAVLEEPAPAAPSFVSVEIYDSVADTDAIAVPHEPPRPAGCIIEIVVADAHIRVAPGVDAATLATVHLTRSWAWPRDILVDHGVKAAERMNADRFHGA